jgi:biopolymer transport protein ExbD
MTAPLSTRRQRSRRPEEPEGVQFPVTPMLDMAFQLLAFFILTFQAPSAETHLDLDLPATPIALPGAPRGKAVPEPVRQLDSDLENDLWVRAEANDLGDLKVLRLGDAPLPDLPALRDRLRRYIQILEGRPLRIRLVADDGLHYEEAARVMATCSAAGVASIRLSDPTSLSVPASARPGDGP